MFSFEIGHCGGLLMEIDADLAPDNPPNPIYRDRHGEQ